MRLILNDQGHESGVYGTVFFVDDQLAVKVFKKHRTPEENDVAVKTFNSECEAYEIAARSDQISKYTKHFHRKVVVCEIVGEDGTDKSDHYLLECAYSMTRLHGTSQKIGTFESSKYQWLKDDFKEHGILYMEDCSLFLDDNEKLESVIDFGVNGFELPLECT
jgi:hypothetical protein